MPILPIIDLLILMGWTSLMFGAVLKAIDVTTRFAPTPLGFSSIDFAVIAGVCFVFALTLAARTWVKLNEPKLAELRRRQDREEAHRRVHPEDEIQGEAAPVIRAARLDGR